jgi:hypothetical protein
MRIAYVTTDEVHEHLAQDMAASQETSLFPLSPRDPHPDGEFDAVLYDWDYLPPGERSEVLKELLAGPACYSRAVHGYNLPESQEQCLRECEVAVFRQLQPEAFLLLRLARSGPKRTAQGTRLVGAPGSPVGKARPERVR